MEILKVKLHPNLEVIKDYLGPWHLKTFKEQGYALLELAFEEEEYQRYARGLIDVIEKYKLSDLKDELLFVIFREDEILNDMLIDDKLKYDYIENTIDVSKFLLAFKNSKDSPNFQIGVKENTGTRNRPINKNYFIKNEEISKWMCQLICDALESGNVPYGLTDPLGTEGLFLNINREKQEISIEKLKRGAELQNKSFNVYRRKRYVIFCESIKIFLEEYTPLKSPLGVKQTDAQANFFFDILSVLGYLNVDKINSDPKDFVHTMFRNSRI